MENLGVKNNKFDLGKLFNFDVFDYSENKSSYKLYLHDISKYDVLSDEECIELKKKYDLGDKDCKEKLIVGNLRLVVSIVKEYSYCNLDMMDLIEEGNMGLSKSIDKWDLSRDSKFSTVAGFYIRSSIQRYIENNRSVVRIPTYLQSINTSLNKIRKEYLNCFGEEIDDELLLEIYNERYSSNSINMDDLKEINYYINNKIISLDCSVNDDDSSLSEIIYNKNDFSVVDSINNVEDYEFLMGNLDKLNNKEKFCLTLYFGIGVEKKNYKEISEFLKCDSRTVKRYIEKGLKKLKEMMEPGYLN